MPSLAQLLNVSSSGQATLTTGAQVEPIGGPGSVDALMDRFPESVYQQGRDTHLYRLISALCGDAGAAMIKKSAYSLRLRNEAEAINFAALDAFYTNHFNFVRLADEIYSGGINPVTDALTNDQWNDVQIKDQSYRARALDFFAATRLGNTPDGMAYAALSATGVDTDVVEHYQYIFDQFSDDPLGIAPLGMTTSTSEFVVVPRVVDTNGVGGSQAYQATREIDATFTPPTLVTTAKPIPAPTGGNKLAVSYAYTTGVFYRLLPSYDHNLVNILDRLGPVGALTTISEDQSRFLPVQIASVGASSERIQVIRYVNGAVDVNWPPLSQTGNVFIEAGVENESGTQFGGTRELPVIFHTIETVNAYTNNALLDPNYNTSNFFGSTGGIAAFYQYRSEATGSFISMLVSIYPFLSTSPASETFSAAQAIAIHNTPLILESAV